MIIAYLTGLHPMTHFASDLYSPRPDPTAIHTYLLRLLETAGFPSALILASPRKDLPLNLMLLTGKLTEDQKAFRCIAPVSSEENECPSVSLASPLPVARPFLAFCDQLLEAQQPELISKRTLTSSSHSALARHAPLMAVPLRSPLLDHSEAFGLLLLYSADHRLTKSERHDAQHLATNVSLVIHAAIMQAALHWHKQAHRTLQSVTRRSLPRSNSTHRSTRLPLRTVVARYVKAMRIGMRLNRCGLLIHSEESPGFFFYLEQQGFPDTFTKGRNFYIRGQGLTGQILTCTPDDIVHEPDVESLRDWRRRKKTVSRKPNEHGSMAFLGVPVFSRYHFDATRPCAAIVCCRFQGERRTSAGFSENEVIHIQNIAAHIGSILDSDSWSNHVTSQISAQKQLTDIWAQPWSPDEKLQESLRILSSHTPFDRILFSLVSRNGSFIEGVAAHGFRGDLITDTRRAIASGSSSDGTDDILALIHRTGIDRPLIVDPLDPSDEYSRHLDQHALVRQRLSNHIVIFPFRKCSGEPYGSVLAELPSREYELTDREVDSANVIVQQIAGHLELAIERTEAQHTDALTAAITQQSLHSFGETEASLTMLRSLIRRCCDELAFSCGLIYACDNRAHVLRGACSFSLNDIAVRETVYPMRSGDDGATRKRTGLVTHVFGKRSTVWLDSMDDARVNLEDASRIGIPGHFSGFACPLLFLGNCVGVLVLAGPTRPHRQASLSPRLSQMIHLASHTLAVRAQTLEQAQLQRELSALEGVINATHRFKVVRTNEARLEAFANENSDVLQLLLSYIKDVFAADMVGLFMPDSAVVSQPTLSPRQGSHIDTPFHLRASIGYPPHSTSVGTLSYTASKRALTAAVLRTLQSARSPNVELDERGSKELNEFAKEACGGTALRTWMGVPVLIAESDSVYVYGVLTCTRGRGHLDDDLMFTEADVLSAERIAKLIALGLHHQDTPGRVSEALRRLIRFFGHHVRGPLDSAQGVHLRSLQRTLDLDGDPKKANALCRLIDESLRFVAAAIKVYGDFASGRLDWIAAEDDTPLAPIGETVSRLASATFTGITVNVSVQDQACSNLDESRIVFILFALVENAARAIRQGKKRSRRIELVITQSDDLIDIRVKDNGCGITPVQRAQMFEEGVSYFAGGSTGLGLTIARNLCSTLPDGKVECMESTPGVGSVFRVSLPAHLALQGHHNEGT